MNSQVADIISLFLYILMGCVLLRSVLSFFPSTQGTGMANLLIQITEPIMEPIRRVMPRVGMFDFSGFIVIILLQLMVAVVQQASGGG